MALFGSEFQHHLKPDAIVHEAKGIKKILHFFKIETSGILQIITLFHKVVEQSHYRLVHILMDNIKH